VLAILSQGLVKLSQLHENANKELDRFRINDNTLYFDVLQAVSNMLSDILFDVMLNVFSIQI